MHVPGRATTALERSDDARERSDAVLEQSDDNTYVPAESVTSDVATKLRLRYPPSRLPRPVLVGAVVALAAVFLGWLLWTASVRSTPEVSGQVLTYEVLSDQQVAVRVTVQRRDPSRAAVCDVVAQAEDFAVVGRLDRLEVPPRAERVVDVTTTIKTLRRGTSASVRSCSLT